MERSMSRRRIIRVQHPVPLGDVTMVPAALSGRGEAEMARAMATLRDFEVPGATDLLGRLLQTLPLAPFGARMTALATMMDRRHSR
jgi:hypothetical protein